MADTRRRRDDDAAPDAGADAGDGLSDDQSGDVFAPERARQLRLREERYRRYEEAQRLAEQGGQDGAAFRAAARQRELERQQRLRDERWARQQDGWRPR